MSWLGSPRAKAARKSPGARSPFGWFFWVAVLGFLSLAGLGLHELWRDLQTRRWPEQPCEIVQSRLDNDPRRSGYVAAVLYRYEVGGTTYTSERIALQPELAHNDYADAAARLARYPKGAKTVCRVNPTDPAEAVLESHPDFVVLVISPFLLMIWALYERVALADWFLGRRQRKVGLAEPITANSALRRSRTKHLVVGCTGALICFGFTVMIWIWPWIQTRRSATWVEVPCVILGTSVGAETYHQGGRAYHAKVLYAYEFQGQRYESSRLDFSDGMHFSWSATRKMLARYSPGQKTMAFVDPTDPHQAVLQRSFHPELFLSLFVAGFGSLSLFLIGRSVFLAEGSVQSPFPWESKKAVQRVAGNSMSLRPEKPPALMLALYVAGAAVCGVVSAWLLPDGIKSLRHGEFDVLPLLYGCAAVIGFFACAKFAAKSWRGAMVGFPKLSVTPPLPRLGEGFTVEWERGPGRDRGFRLWLEGEEQAAVVTEIPTPHGPSRDEKTQRTTFYRQALTPEDRFETALLGQCRGTVPEHSMHSFEALKVKIVWRIRVEAQDNSRNLVANDYRIIVRPASEPS